MKKFHIIANSYKDPNGEYTAVVEKKIRELNAEVTSFEEAEAIIVLGGDGTLLQVAGENIGLETPLLGVNIGTLGYLAETDMSEIDVAITRLIEDDYTIDERMMLYGRVESEDGEVCDHALNDVAITGCGALCIVRYDLYVNGELLNSYSADGLVISTPTGSTGYNMSAGGPIVDPKANMLVVTPICPHTLNTRSIVLSPEAEIRVQISDSQRTPVAVQFDGRSPYMVGPGKSAYVIRSSEITRTIKLHKESFLNTLHAKLK